MSGKAAKVTCTEKQKNILERIKRSTTAPQRLIQRVGIILMAVTGSFNVEIASEVGLARKQVGLSVGRRQPTRFAMMATWAAGPRQIRSVFLRLQAQTPVVPLTARCVGRNHGF